jgi:hypothetical protein
MNISIEKTVFICYNFIKELKRLYNSKYTIYTDGASYYNQSCKWLRIKHIVYNDNCKNIMKGYSTLKIELGAFDDYFPCKDDCSKKHVKNWLSVYYIL